MKVKRMEQGRMVATEGHDGCSFVDASEDVQGRQKFHEQGEQRAMVRFCACLLIFYV